MAKQQPNMKVTEDFKESFLNMLEVLPNITAVCRLLGVSTKNLSKHRKADAEFEAEIKEAVERGYDMLEEEARRRAVDGVLKPVFFKGMECGQIREYSDQLLVTLLKGYRPKKFNPGVKIEGGDGRKVTMTFNIGGDDAS